MQKKTDTVVSKYQTMAFDLLYCNGESVVTKPLLARQALLSTGLSKPSDALCLIKSAVLDRTDTEFSKKVMTLYNRAKEINCEGLMLKATHPTNSFYDTTGSRRQWIKVVSAATS